MRISWNFGVTRCFFLFLGGSFTRLTTLSVILPNRVYKRAIRTLLKKKISPVRPVFIIRVPSFAFRSLHLNLNSATPGTQDQANEPLCVPIPSQSLIHRSFSFVISVRPCELSIQSRVTHHVPCDCLTKTYYVMLHRTTPCHTSHFRKTTGNLNFLVTGKKKLQVPRKTRCCTGPCLSNFIFVLHVLLDLISANA